jgi:hypothetical protein
MVVLNFIKTTYMTKRIHLLQGEGEGFHPAGLARPERMIRQLLTAFYDRAVPEVFPLLGTPFRLNDFSNLSEPELQYLVQRHRQRFGEIECKSVGFRNSHFHNGHYIMKGWHVSGNNREDRTDIIHGEWMLEMRLHAGQWQVVGMDVGGVEF